MSFLSADGFPITLDGVVEFRILPDKVAEMFVKYNETANGDAIDEEIIAKIITPESRSLCRIGGSKLSGGQFISGEDREKFQTDLVKSLTENCQKQGIEILAVAITSIQPPDDIAQPVQQREVAKQKLAQFRREKLQQLSEAKLKVEVVLAEQKKRVVEAEQEVVEKTTKAEQEQQVAVTLAEQKLKVAQTQLEAAKDKASAILAKAEADAEVVKFDNAAEAAGLAAQVSAFDGDGAAMARNMLLGKLAPSFRTILGNSEGPLMDLFSQFTRALRQAAVVAGRGPGLVATSTARRPAPRPRPHRPSIRSARVRPGPRDHRGHPGGDQAMNPFRARSLGTVGRAAAGRRRPRPGRLLRCLAMDDLPHRGPAGLEPPGPLQGPLAVWLPAPGARGNPGEDRRVGPPAPGRHPRGHARPRTPLLLAAGIRDPARQGRGHSPRQDRRRGLQDRQTAARGHLPGRREGISRHPPQGADAGALSHQQVCFRRQDRGCGCLRRGQHEGQAQGRRPDADPAGLCRRGDQQGE